MNPGVWPQYSAACRADVDRLLARGGTLSAYRANRDYGLGPCEASWAWRLERAIKAKTGVKYAVVLNSGTAALHAALAYIDVSGKSVVTSPYTFSATAAAILLAGGYPCFADVDPNTYQITPETVASALRHVQNVGAILPVSLFGKPCDTKGLAKLGYPVIEDACQAVGVSLGPKASATVWSFNGMKNVPAGEGGALLTDDKAVAEKARLLGNHGENFGTPSVGLNYRMNELTACVAWHGLKDLDKRNRRRSELVRLALPEVWEPNHAYYVAAFTVKRGTRHRFIKRCKKRGLEVSGGYITPPLHRYKAFIPYARAPLPNVEELSYHTLCLISTLRPPATNRYARWVRGVLEEARRGL